MIKELLPVRLRELVLRVGAGPKEHMKSYTEACVVDLAQLVSGLAVFRCRKLQVDARFLSRLKGCAARSWQLETCCDSQMLAQLVLANPQVQHMSLHANCITDAFALAIRSVSTSATFDIRLQGQVAPPDLVLCPNLVGLAVYDVRVALLNLFPCATTLRELRLGEPVPATSISVLQFFRVLIFLELWV